MHVLPLLIDFELTTSYEKGHISTNIVQLFDDEHSAPVPHINGIEVSSSRVGFWKSNPDQNWHLIAISFKLGFHFFNKKIPRRSQFRFQFHMYIELIHLGTQMGDPNHV
jgi:hypothetical protein